ncbi:hypothetical protein BDV26DRAFT_273050 [Aspergillus bertholletiae]|uniref:Uncharacterized protein n=1 Tax=Aspergillus bertholletiae TaxID=1226010 RepID=A0A5N7ATD2_9EURO|nr:hypothetical protein BDV26DRAFT_273050 [Aspergillus bertholletiae]
MAAHPSEWLLVGIFFSLSLFLSPSRVNLYLGTMFSISASLGYLSTGANARYF